MHQLCQLDEPGYSSRVLSTLNLGYDEPKRRKFAVFSECLRLIAGSIVPVLRTSGRIQAHSRQREKFANLQTTPELLPVRLRSAKAIFRQCEYLLRNRTLHGTGRDLAVR